MNRKIVFFAVLAVAGIALVFVATGAAVLAYTFQAEPAQVEAINEAPAIEVAPIQAEVEPVLDRPVINYDHASYEGGCAFSKTKLQMTEKAPAETIQDAPLAQAAE